MNITLRDGLAIALKILGFYFIYRGLSYLITIAGYLTALEIPSLLKMIESSGISKFAMFAPAAVPFIMSIVMAYILLRYSDKIAEKLIKIDKEIQIFSADNWQKEVFTLALRIYGAYEIAKRFATLVWQIVPSTTYQKAVEKALWPNIVYTLVCIVIGLYFLAGAKHLVNLVFKEKKAEPIASNPVDGTAPSA